MIRIAICDVDEGFVDNLIEILREEALKKDIRCNFSRFVKPKLLIDELREGKRFDIVFLETHIGKECGVVLGKDIKSFDKKIDLVYLSYTQKYVLDCFDMGAFNYILKPIADKERLVVQFERLLIKYYMNRGGYLKIKEGTGGARLPINKISYIETVGKLVRIHYEGRYIDVHERMIDLEESLEKVYFIRCHKSYLVNAKHVLRMNKSEIELTKGILIPVSRLRVKKIKEVLQEFYENRDII